MRVYLCGMPPATPAAALQDAEGRLTEAGHEVVWSAAWLPPGLGVPRRVALGDALGAMGRDADAAALLPGWQSDGAAWAEAAVAAAMGVPAVPLGRLLGGDASPLRDAEVFVP